MKENIILMLNTKKRRYHERYYPESIYHDDRSDYDDERERAPVRQQVS